MASFNSSGAPRRGSAGEEWLGAFAEWWELVRRGSVLKRRTVYEKSWKENYRGAARRDSTRSRREAPPSGRRRGGETEERHTPCAFHMGRLRRGGGVSDMGSARAYPLRSRDPRREGGRGVLQRSRRSGRGVLLRTERSSR